jgi:glutathione S-transferase
MKFYYSTNLNPRVAVAVARHLQSPVEYVFASPRHPAWRAPFAGLDDEAPQAAAGGSR